MQNVFLKYQAMHFLPAVVYGLIFFCFFFPSVVLADKGILVNADGQFRYAEDCFSKEDYLSAVFEYKRFVFLFPEDGRGELARYKTGLSLYRAGKYREAIRFFRQFEEKYSDTKYTRKASFLIARAYLALDRKGDAIISLNNLTMLTEDVLTKDRAYYELGWIWLERPSYQLSFPENERHATSYFKKVSPVGQKELKIKELEDELQKYESLSQKNPTLAGSLSVVPGIGQLYCERYQDSVTAFLLNMAFGLAAYEAFDHENYALGGLISTVGFGFYAGNIYGAVSSAHKYNRNLRRNFIESLKQNIKIHISSRLEDNDIRLSLESVF
jgi:tetratricopeptide (TPR) repeat protein